MKRTILSFIQLADRLCSGIFRKFSHEKPALIAFAFHVLFRNEEEFKLNMVNPQQGIAQGITVEHFRQFVEYFVSCGYSFVSPEDIINGLSGDGRYILLTFDDGYFNNINALPILNQYKVPAVFFITSNNVKHNECFWWDVLYRERMKLGSLGKAILREWRWLCSMKISDVKQYLINLFGEKIFRPISDIDRPFTPEELKDFSKEEYVFIGNHASDHVILTNYSLPEIKSQILAAQQAIYEMTQIMPVIISYPNGRYSGEVIRTVQDIGLRLGVTGAPGKNCLPIVISNKSSMCLGRFSLWENGNILDQCKLFRSGIAIYSMLQNLFKRSY